MVSISPRHLPLSGDALPHRLPADPELISFSPNAPKVIITEVFLRISPLVVPTSLNYQTSPVTPEAGFSTYRNQSNWNYDALAITLTA